MLILNIETSTTACSVALAEDNTLLAFKEENNGYTHAEHITIFIDAVLKEADRKISELNAVAVSSGPGSYTGLRIGASTAKGLCYALDVPLISISTLKAMASSGYHWISKNDLLCPMIDARRMEVYCAVLDYDLTEVISVTAKIIDVNSFSDLLHKQKIFFFGDGAEKCKPFLTIQPNAVFLENIFPSAKTMVNLSYQKFKDKQFEDISLFEPFYLKEFTGKKNYDPPGL